MELTNVKTKLRTITEIKNVYKFEFIAYVFNRISTGSTARWTKRDVKCAELVIDTVLAEQANCKI